MDILEIEKLDKLFQNLKKCFLQTLTRGCKVSFVSKILVAPFL